MACMLSRSLYVFFEFIAFALVLIGTPIDMFRARGVDIVGNTGCITLWGAKEKCYSTKYDLRPSDLFAVCSDRTKRWQAAEALALISIVALGVAVLLGLITALCVNCLRWFCLVLNIVAVITLVVIVAIMVEAYTKPMQLCPKLSVSFQYGAGFGLIVVGWILNLLNIIMLFLPC